MLTDEQSDLLIEYYKNVHFSESQKKEIIQLYWQATNEERREISKVYCKLFATDSVFIQRLIQYKDAMGSGEAGATTGEEMEDASHAPSAGNRVTHAQRLLRSSIADQFPILRREENKNRTFQLQFELVVSESQRREVIDLYSSQFISPEPAELLDLVPLSNTFSTRTRRQVQGHYSFLIRLLNPPADPDDANCRQQTKVVCAVTINAHTHSSASHKFIEMPLFATAAGYKKNGFAKLLNTALCEWVSVWWGSTLL
ncbi:hypothetical protein AGDE_09167 [Angomonas deanei]|nr:hypothetical protein AGDE_09167 [Angomonas deanei]|eukprot:EPY31211.1 hypothetical protein AGDE_09167 [Angomonas deanei]